MEITCGTDIIEIDRIKKCIEPSNERFKERVYTEKEIKYCESRKNQKYQHYAARFAGKEAVFKALSKYIYKKFEISWKDAEIINDETGRPEVIINHDISAKVKKIDISISHCKEYAIANVVIVWNL